jgi:hypothetical protein
VNFHLITIPCLTSFTTGGFAGGDSQDLRWQADRSLDTEILGLRTVDELRADLLERLHISGSEGNADLVDLWAFTKVLLALVVRHFECKLPRTVLAKTFPLNAQTNGVNTNQDLNAEFGNVMISWDCFRRYAPIYTISPEWIAKNWQGVP